MAWPTVTSDAITSRWRPLTDEESVIVEQLLEDAENEVQIKLLENGISDAPAGDLWAKLYVRIVATMVRRVLLNPDGWLEEQERIDDYGVTRRRDSAVSTGGMYLAEAELASLLANSARRPRGAFSIRTV